MPKIWLRLEGRRPECIDECAKHEVGIMLYNYKMSYACLVPRNHRYGKDHVWAGLMRDEPPIPTKETLW